MSPPSDEEAAESHFGSVGAAAAAAALTDVGGIRGATCRRGGGGVESVEGGGGGGNKGSTTNPVEDMASGVSGCSFVPPPGVGMMSRGTVWWCREDVAEDDVDDDACTGTLVVH